MSLYQIDGKRPTLPANGDCWVAPGAIVVGDVRLSEGCGVWFNASIRGDNEPIVIGPRSNVQEGAVLHVDPDYPMTIGADVTIGHLAMVHGCTIGDGSLVGMSAVVMNGAKVGRNCLIGAGALVREGQQIPDGSLVVGAPARIARALNETGLAHLKRAADVYVKRMRSFRDGMTPI